VSAAKSESTLLLSLMATVSSLPYVILASVFLFGSVLGTLGQQLATFRPAGVRVSAKISRARFRDMMTDANGVSDAFSDMARSVVDDLIKIVNQPACNCFTTRSAGPWAAAQSALGKLTPLASAPRFSHDKRSH
jgi:hypothetical protein